MNVELDMDSKTVLSSHKLVDFFLFFKFSLKLT